MAELRICFKCGGARTHVIGHSVSPAVLYLHCTDCGHSTAVAPPAPPVVAMNAPRVERLVRSVIADFDVPFALLAVVDAVEGWQVVVRMDAHRIVRFPVHAATPSVMRATIRRALEDAR